MVNDGGANMRKLIIAFIAFFVIAALVLSVVPGMLAAKDDFSMGEQIREKVMEHKEALEDAKLHYRGAKQNLENKANEFKTINKDRFMEAATNRLVAHIDMLVSLLERAELTLEDTDMAEGALEQLLGIKDEILVTEDISKDTLKEKAEEVKELWAGVKFELKLSFGMYNGKKVGNIMVKLDQLQVKLDRMKDHLVEQGLDVVALDEYLKEFESQFAEAQSLHEEARELFVQAHESEDIEEKHDLITQAHEKQKEALDLVKDIRDTLRDIVHEIREQKADELGEPKIN